MTDPTLTPEDSMTRAEAIAAQAETRAAWVAQVRAEFDARRRAERDRVPLTRADVEGATDIRDRWGWHRVLRVNHGSVTIDGGAWGRETVPLVRVLEVRRP